MEGAAMMRASGLRGPVKFQSAPLFKMADAPFKRATLGGYHVGDLIWFHVPGQPGVKHKGRVINILPTFHSLIMRVECPDRIVELNPITNPALVSARLAPVNA